MPTIITTCSWCHSDIRVVPGAITLCAQCGHEGDRPRLDCRCPRCRRPDRDQDLDRETVTTLCRRLTALGCEPGRPAHVSVAAVEMDRLTAAEGVCEHCGRPGLCYVPWRRPGDAGGYWGVAWCPSCRSALEM